MSVTFTKLFSSITESTVWCEPDRTRLCWIAMLAMADRRGRVWASVPGLANRARVPLDDARIAIATFLAPDPDSRTPDHNGRRIEPIEGGWCLINYEKYREMRDDDERREYQREWDRTKRVRNPIHPTDSDKILTPTTKAEAEAEAEASKPKTRPLSPQESLQALLMLGVAKQVAVDWMAVRKAKNAPLTLTAINRLQNEAKKAGIDVARAVLICAERNWQSFNASWDWKDTAGQTALPKVPNWS